MTLKKWLLQVFVEALFLPMLTVCVVLLIDGIQLPFSISLLDHLHPDGAWDFGWSALEAVGTLLAVGAAIFLAWWEGTRDKRRLAKQRRVVRDLLIGETEANLNQVRNIMQWSIAGRDRILVTFYKTLPDTPGEEWKHWQATVPEYIVRQVVKDRLEEQLGLYSLTVEPDEVEQINQLYEALQDIETSARLFDWEKFEAMPNPLDGFAILITQCRDANSIGTQLLECLQHR